MRLRIIGAIIAILLFSFPAFALTLEWTNPATFTDGSMIPASTLSQGFVRFFTGDTATGPWARIPSTSPGLTLAYPAAAWDFPAGYPVDGKWYTMTFVVPCNPALPMLDDGTNKCSSGYAPAVQYIATAPPPPPPPPPVIIPTPAAPTGLKIL